MPGMPPPSPSNGSLLSPDSAAAPLSAGTSGRPKRWTPAEAQSLAQAVSIHGESRWREILLDEKFAAFFAGRSPQSLVRKWGRMSSRSPSIGAPSVHRPAESAAIPVNIDQTRYSDSSLGVSTSLPAHLRSYPY
uniref:Myb-like domain-containing protein n=2 Tax=Spongospora subterranea TaxID=70186 RepID=A0A0H5QVW9_9EUKA|eukprot:CRZ06070.1 hypothetical protein [Spongospora subterranea]